jgi:hypothetical protein
MLRDANRLKKVRGVETYLAQVELPGMDNDRDEFDQPLLELRTALDVEWSTRSDVPPPEVYHYASASSFAGIIRSQRLWATISSELIDSRELLHAADILRSILRRRAITSTLPEYSILYPPQVTHFDFGRPDTIEVYVASLSAAGDDVSQWERYADNRYGLAIGFDTLVLQTLHAAQTLRQPMAFVQVNYDEAQQSEFLELLVDTWERQAAAAVARDMARSRDPLMFIAAWLGNLATCVSAILPCMKSEHYRAEREWRLIHGHVPGLPLDCVVVGERGHKPHVELDLTQLKGELPLTSVRLGPGVSNDDSKRLVREFLDQHGFSRVPIHYSGASLRIQQRVVQL